MTNARPTLNDAMVMIDADGKLVELERARAQVRTGIDHIRHADDALVLRPGASLFAYIRHRLKVQLTPHVPTAALSPAGKVARELLDIVGGDETTRTYFGAFGTKDEYVILANPLWFATLGSAEEALYVWCHEIWHRLSCDSWWLAQAQSTGLVGGQPFDMTTAQMALDARVNAALDEINAEHVKSVASRSGSSLRQPCGDPPTGANAPFRHPLIDWRLTQTQAYLILYEEQQQESRGRRRSQGGPQDWGEIDPHEGPQGQPQPTAAELERSLAQARAASSAAVARASGRGRLSAAMARGLAELLTPPYDITAIIRSTVIAMLPGDIEDQSYIDRRAMADLYRQRKAQPHPARLGLTSDIYHPTSGRPKVYPTLLPGHRAERHGTMVLVADVSGSMGQSDLKKVFGSAADAAGKLLLDRMLLLQVEADVVAVHEIGSAEEVAKLEIKGGGGTDMRVGIREAQAMQEDGRIDKIACCIVATDGLTPWPDEPPAFPVLVILTRPSRAVPDWADVIEWH